MICNFLKDHIIQPYVLKPIIVKGLPWDYVSGSSVLSSGRSFDDYDSYVTGLNGYINSDKFLMDILEDVLTLSPIQAWHTIITYANIDFSVKNRDYALIDELQEISKMILY